MIVSNVAPSTAQQSTPQTPPSQTVDKNGFLKLLIAQLQNQDPLQPMDNQQFAVQLATFNSLEQLMDIDKQLTALQVTQGQANQFNAASLIGKQVEADGNSITLASGGSTNFGYRLSSDAASVTVKIQDSSGNLVRQLQLGPQPAGDQTITWDGKDATGRVAAAGTYSFQVTASDATGNQIAAASHISGTVNAVNFGGSEPVLDLGTVQIPLSGVTAISSQK
ncbi:MAG TPA: FlgD immunoglobulin-like domain containing protein [Candidatus Binatia bacterium]|jgi:flagellar basal-body rod modification protein FlgD